MAPEALPTQADTESLYFELLKQVLTRSDLEQTYRALQSRTGVVRSVLNPLILRTLEGFGLELRKRVDHSRRGEGRDWPSEAETMIGLLRLNNIQECVLDVLATDTPGDLIETGVWRGGATIFMRGILKARGVTDRAVWVADSFQGLPKPDGARYPHDQADEHWTNSALSVSVEQVRANFAKYRLLDDQVRFLAGWFRDTLPSAPIERLAILRLDGDMYESTIVALEALYPKLSPGGYLIVDDYNAVAGCKAAVQDYRERNRIQDEITPIDWTGVFWQKSAESAIPE